MPRLLLFVVTILLTIPFTVSANSLQDAVSPTGAYPERIDPLIDDFGDIIRTIPSPVPGPENALVGACWADGILIVFENVYPYTGPSKFHKIDPDDGTILGEVTLPFDGWVMGASYDGDGIWVVQWYTVNEIYKIDIDGNLISQFTPATGDYSCRTVAYEDGSLWVGANAGFHDTRLYKMAADGAILEEYNTSSAVGWYMDGEVATQAPADLNLAVNDYVGNTIKRLNVEGGVVTIADQFVSPVAFSDYPEGLTYDGEYLWHNAALAQQGLIWCLDASSSAPPPPPEMIVEVDYVSGSPIPPEGGNLYYSVYIENISGQALWCDAWADVVYEGGPPTTIILRSLENYQPGWAINRPDAYFPVPGSYAAGTYEFIVRTGIHPDSIWHQDSFTWSKSGESDGPFDPGSVAISESFTNPFETIQAGSSFSIPTEFIVRGAHPNPFNPSTQISFVLHEDDFVTLSIYDVAGRLVTTLVEEWYTSGHHSAWFDASGLPSGLYFYRIKTASQISMGKMVLLK